MIGVGGYLFVVFFALLIFQFSLEEPSSGWVLINALLGLLGLVLLTVGLVNRIASAIKASSKPFTSVS